MEQLVVEEVFLKLWDKAEKNNKTDDDKVISQMKRLVEYHRLLGKFGKR